MSPRILPRLFALVAYVVGCAGQGLFLLAIVGVGTGGWPWKPADDGVQPWLINLGWLLLFALQHSGMARQSFKRWWTRWIPSTLERSTYVAVSGIVLAALTLGWQPLPGEPLWHGPLWIEAIALSAVVGVGVVCLGYDHLTFLGLQPAWTGDPAPPGSLRVTGLYRWVRHPLMLGLLIALWAQPIMPTGLLMLNAGFTVYILVAIRLEERDLIRQFGAEYEAYQRAVPALFPFLRW